MKRGNTALKRGVGLASAFALAIAGAVIAAPAANAVLPSSNADIVRAKPIANADQIDAGGNKLAAPTGLNTAYGNGTSGTVSTGNVPTIQAGVKNQHVSDLQIFVPGTSSATLWENNGTVTVDLPAGVTLNTTPNVSVAAKTVTVASYANKAAGTATTNAVSNGSSIVATYTGSQITLKAATGAVVAATSADNTEALLVTVSGIYVDVADDYATKYTTSAGDNAVSAVVKAGATALGTTTLAYVSSFSVSADGTYPANAKSVALPDVTITELTKAGFATTNQAITLTLSTDPAGSPTAASFDTASATAAGSGSDAIEDANLTAAGSATTLTITIPSTANQTDASKIESITVSGLKVKDVPAGSKIVLTVATPKGTVSNSASPSFTPAQADFASVSIASAIDAPRIAGANRYATAAAIAKAGTWTGNAVVLANGTDAKLGIDALSANFLAGTKKAPILLTDSSNTLSMDTQLALTRLFQGKTGTPTIYVMGKTDSVSQAVRDSAKAIVEAAADSSATVKVVEVAGDDRYATSAAAAEAGKAGIRSYDLGKGSEKTAFLASGQVNADALSAGALSAGLGIPVLLAQDSADALPKSVSDSLTAQHIEQVIILGGTDHVSSKVEDALKAAGVNVVRVAGSDRYQTSADLNTLLYKAAPNGLGQTTAGKTVYLANGSGGFADALAVGPFAGQLNNVSPLLTVPTSSLPSGAETFLKAHTDLNAVKALGKSDRIADSVVTAAQQAIIPAS